LEIMEGIVTFKFIVEENGKQTGDIRRVTLKKPVGLDMLRSAACDILGWKNTTFRFKDEDGDVVTVASQHELDTAIAFANGGAVRFVVDNQEEEKPKEEQKEEVKPTSTPEVAAAAAVPEVAAAPEVPPVSALEAASNATIPENVMVQFSVIAEFFQKMAKQMADFAPRIPAIVNEGIRKMSVGMQNNFSPLDVTVEAARGAAAAEQQVPLESFNLVIHRLPESVVHPGVECTHCHKKPLTGMRYKCVNCECDLCQDCVVLPNVHTPGHRFLPVCAPAVGSHIVNSATEACTQLKNRAEPVVQTVRTAVDEAVADARVKGAELGDKVKQQVATVKETIEKKVVPQHDPSSITEKERETLQQLQDMGFTDEEKLLPLIRKHKCNLASVIEALIH